MKYKVADYMSAPAVTVGEDQLLSSCKRMMAEHNIRHLPVLRGGQSVGILSDRDIKLAYAVEYEKANNLLAKDVFSDEVFTAKPGDDLGMVAGKMAEAGLGSAVVVDDRGHVVGIFTATDACRVVGMVCSGG